MELAKGVKMGDRTLVLTSDEMPTIFKARKQHGA